MTAFRIEVPDENWANLDSNEQAALAGRLMKYFQERYNWKVHKEYCYDSMITVYKGINANPQAVVILATIAMGLDLEFVLTHIFEEMVDETFAS